MGKKGPRGGKWLALFGVALLAKTFEVSLFSGLVGELEDSRG